MKRLSASDRQDTGVGGLRRIMLASRENERLAPLAEGLWMLTNSEIHQAKSRLEAMHLLREKRIDLVVIDETLSDVPGLELAKLVAREHPFVNCILVDGASPAGFHERTEGLGLLMQLPSPPDMADAKSIMSQLAAIDASW